MDSDLNFMHRQVAQLRNYSGKRFMERKLRKQRVQRNQLRQVKREQKIDSRIQEEDEIQGLVSV